MGTLRDMGCHWQVSVQVMGTQAGQEGAVCQGRPLGAPGSLSGWVGLLWGEVLLPQGRAPGGESRSLQGSNMASVAKTARPFSGHPGGHPGALWAVIPAWLGVGPPKEEACV